MGEYDKNAANVSLKTLLIEFINRIDAQTSANGFSVDIAAIPETGVDITKVNGVAVSTDNPLPVQDKAFNTITGNAKIEHSGALPLVEGAPETMLSGQSISGDTNTSDFNGVRNWKEFLVEITSVAGGSNSDATYTLKHRTDNGSVYHTIKDRFGNDCSWSNSIASGNTEAKLFEIAGYYQNIRVEISGVTNSQTPVIGLYPRK